MVRRQQLIDGAAVRRHLFAVLAAFGLFGCSGSAYYWQAASGQLQIWRLARPVDEARSDQAVAAAVRSKLAVAASIRSYATEALGLPDNASFTRYADLGRPYVVWNVFAAQPLSVRAHEWCFPIAGCVGYRGYFAEADARAYADSLRAQGYDVHVSGVPAYSTLGWFDDPLLNTFMHYPDTELARLIFHELAHQLAYAKGDTEFNESFAVAVEQEGLRRWLAQRGDGAQTAAFARTQAMRADFADLVLRYRARLDALYASDAGDDEKLRMKASTIAELGLEYQRMKHERWGGFAGYDRWFGQAINNATLASIGLYTQLLPELRALLAREQGDLPRFFAAVRALAEMPKAQRRRTLAAYSDPQPVRLAADEACGAFPTASNLGILCRPSAAHLAAPRY